MKGAWHLTSLPFHVGTQGAPSNGALPDTLPFTLAVDERLGLIVQAPDTAVMEALEHAYTAGSQPGTPMAPSGIGRRYLDDFLDWVEREDGRPLRGLRVLELGAGTGALLTELARRGAHCVGVDPGPAPPGLPPGVTYRSEPFRADAFDEPFDLILHFTVLEHIAVPDAFLREQCSLLAPGGRVAFAVPDCEPALRHGDLSMLFHEHMNYFTRASLAGLSPEGARIGASSWGGLLYATWTGADANRAGGPEPDLAGYRRQAEDALAAIRGFADGVGPAGLGVFVPARFFNYLALLDLDPAALRFFDDDVTLRGRYYPPFAIPVEARDALAAGALERILVASWSFGRRIADELRADPRLAGVQIRAFEDLL